MCNIAITWTQLIAILSVLVNFETSSFFFLTKPLHLCTLWHLFLPMFHFLVILSGVFRSCPFLVYYYFFLLHINYFMGANFLLILQNKCKVYTVKYFLSALPSFPLSCYLNAIYIITGSLVFIHKLRCQLLPVMHIIFPSPFLSARLPFNHTIGWIFCSLIVPYKTGNALCQFLFIFQPCP
jgi:hypothetical protein